MPISRMPLVFRANTVDTTVASLLQWLTNATTEATEIATKVAAVAGESIASLGDVLLSSEMAVFVAILGTLLAYYRYFYNQPELLLDAAPSDFDPIVGPDSTSISAELSLVNAGNAAAKDVYLSFTLPDWRFDDDDITDVQETTLKIDEERTYGFIGVKSERHDIFVDNIIYEEDTFSLYYNHPEFESDGCYRVEYVVACNNHGPREGSIFFCIDGQDLTIHREYPTLWRNVRAKLGWTAPEESRTVSVR